jgi:hypothetical protein
MLLDACLPANVWGEALVAANHIRNRCPASAKHTKTPWELFVGTVPDISYLRAYGCKVFVTLPKEKHTKLVLRQPYWVFSDMHSNLLEHSYPC